MARKKNTRLLGVIDFETDPFLFGREPKPFAAGFYSQEEGYKEFWGDDCVYDLCAFLEKLSPHLIYAHNGGRFDFHFLLQKQLLTNPALIIHGRIVKCGILGLHELRDSYAILPLALAKLGDKSKLEIDYKKLEAENRMEHKREISEYLEYDCRSLYRFVHAFIERFGAKLTIGATAIAQLGKLHPVRRLTKDHDRRFREFYFGGRVECFEYGEITGDLKIYDINSSYPNSMRNFQHPNTKNYLDMDAQKMFNNFDHSTGIIKDFGTFYFAEVEAENAGCLPSRITEGERKGGITFDKKTGIFFACSHEIQAGIKLGILKIISFKKVLIPCNTGNFKEFVDKFVSEKINGKIENDEVKTVFSKLILNSSYGKFATNCNNFKNWFILDLTDENCLLEFRKWTDKNTIYDDDDMENVISCPSMYSSHGSIEMWDAPADDDKGWYDVAVAASITSASRAVLLNAIHHSTRPIYTDTDSIVCEKMGDEIPLHPTDLGAWDLEGITKKIYIAGKKIYAAKLDDVDGNPILNDRGERLIKIASKGARLSYDDVKKLTQGKIVHWKNAAPNFKLSGDVKFIERNIIKRY